MVKSAEPQPSTSGYRKKQQDSQETDTKAKKGELIQNKNSDDPMDELFWGVFEEQSRRRMDEVWRMWLMGTQECAGYERRAFICDVCE